MSHQHAIKDDMEVIGADGVHVGAVDHVGHHRIKLKKTHAGAHGDHHHYISLGLVSGVDGNQVRLSANANVAVEIFEEEPADH